MQEIRDFVRHFHPNQIIFIPQKVLRIVNGKGASSRNFQNLLCDQDNFSKWEILHKWDILRRKQSTAKRSTKCYISQRIGWVIKGRLSNLWGTACKVLTEVAIEYIPSRSTTSQLLNGNVSLEILRKEAFFI